MSAGSSCFGSFSGRQQRFRLPDHIRFGKCRLLVSRNGICDLGVSVEKNPAPQLKIQKSPTALSCGRISLTMGGQEMLDVAWLDKPSFCHATIGENRTQPFKELIP